MTYKRQCTALTRNLTLSNDLQFASARLEPLRYKGWLQHAMVRMQLAKEFQRPSIEKMSDFSKFLPSKKVPTAEQSRAERGHEKKITHCWGNQRREMYGNLEGLPQIIMHCFGW